MKWLPGIYVTEKGRGHTEAYFRGEARGWGHLLDPGTSWLYPRKSPRVSVSCEFQFFLGLKPGLDQAWEATLTVGAVSTRDGALPGSHAAADANPTCDPKLVLAVVQVGSAGGTQGRRGLERCRGATCFTGFLCQ